MQTVNYVYVLARDGSPLMPTKRYGKVRRMLRDELAVVVSHTPFVIQLTYEPTSCVTQPLYVGIDPGRTNIGAAVINDEGDCIYRAHVKTRNKEIPELMKKRKVHRRASRYGERLARKRLAKRFGTTQKNIMCRKLPGCNKYVIVKDIINTEARFNNRKRSEGWLTPTATQLLRTHVNLVKKICKILPITDICLEHNSFVFMAMEDSTIWQHKVDFQNGFLNGNNNLHEAIFAMQYGKCLLCGKNDIEQYHHVLPRYKGGSNTIDNIVGLCSSCHEEVHKDREANEELNAIHTKSEKKYGALSVINQIIPPLFVCLDEMFPNHTHAVYGYDTKKLRESCGLDKNHDLDAYCIAMQAMGIEINESVDFSKTYELIQFRRHNRALVHAQHERIYQFDGKTVAKNRHKHLEQKELGLDDWYIDQKNKFGEKIAELMRSQLRVKKSVRIYNPAPKTRKFAPGDVVLYLGKRYIVTGQKCKGQYLLFYGFGSSYFKASQCQLERRSTGLEYVV